MAIYHSVSQLVGNTPLLSVDNYVRQRQLPATILAKLERFNPAGSAKDRIALEMLDQAEATGALQPGGTVIEPTSGNTGIGLAAMAVARGYRVILTMPASMSAERRAMLKAYGAELVLVETGGILTPELVEEGFVREIISKIQTMRKEAGFEVVDHIRVYFAQNDKIKTLVDSNNAEIKDEVLANEICFDTIKGYNKEWNINGETVVIGVEKENA